MARAVVFAFPVSTLTPFRAAFLHPRLASQDTRARDHHPHPPSLQIPSCHLHFGDRHLQGLPRFRGGGRSRGIAADLPNGEEGKRKTQWRRERWEKNMKRGQEREETVACGRGWWRTGLLTVEIPGRGGVGPGAPQGRGWHRRQGVPFQADPGPRAWFCAIRVGRACGGPCG